MTQPTWISNDLLQAATSLHSHATFPLFITITPFNITFCQLDGSVYTHWLTPSLPDSSASSNTATLEPIPAKVQTILDDLNATPATTVPDILLPPGDIEQQTGRLIMMIIHEFARSIPNQHKQLHLAYLLGSLHVNDQEQLHNLLRHRFTRQRRYQLVRGITRTYQFVKRIGLPRLYSTTNLSFRDLSHLPGNHFETFLLPNLPESSEDLASNGGAHVTANEDWPSLDDILGNSLADPSDPGSPDPASPNLEC